jgi:predicted MFS family arabinose efflux permease
LLSVANIYYVQTLAGPLSADIGLSPDAAGLVVTMTQLGYAAGLLFIAPLGDLIENRRLVVVLTSAAAISLAAMGLARNAPGFFAAAFMTGLSSVGVQVLLPLAAHLAPAHARGRVIGEVQSGLLLGIMLARPAASFLTQLLSWRWPFLVAAALMAVLAPFLRAALPIRSPQANAHYGALLGSMVRLALTTPVLWRKAFYQFCLFGAFSLFWTTAPLLLAGSEFNLSQSGIALFAVAGVAGAIATPVAGRLADAGYTRVGTGAAMATVAAAFGMSFFASHGARPELALLTASAVFIDLGVQANLNFGARAVLSLSARDRSRLNSLFIGAFFCGGAAGSALGAWAFARGGWALAAGCGLALTFLALLAYATEWRGRPRRMRG